MDLDALKTAVGAGRAVVTHHAFVEMLAEGITDERVVWASIVGSRGTGGRLPRRRAWCLLPAAERVIRRTTSPYGGGHPAPRMAAQLAVPAIAVLITAYRPDLRPHEWSADYRTRRQPPIP